MLSLCNTMIAEENFENLTDGKFTVQWKQRIYLSTNFAVHVNEQNQQTNKILEEDKGKTKEEEQSKTQKTKEIFGCGEI